MINKKYKYIIILLSILTIYKNRHIYEQLLKMDNLYKNYNLKFHNEYELLNIICKKQDQKSLKEWYEYGNIYILLEKDININMFFKLYKKSNLENKIVENILEIRKKDIFGNNCIENCQICLNKKYTNVCILQCKHSFHINCIEKWIIYNNKKNCPLCRTQIN